MAIIREWREKNLIQHQQNNLELKTNPAISLDNFIKRIHAEFPDLHASINTEGRLAVKLGTRNSTNKNHETNWESTIQEHVGFSHVFKMLVKSRKPLVGHNLLMDLMLMYQHLYQPLPPSLTEFKHNLLKLFSCIIDTKQLCNIVRREYNVLLSGTSLGEVYGQLSSAEWSLQSLCAPDISIANSHIKKVTSFHQAGNDAYSAGFVFLRLGHLMFMNGECCRIV